MADFIPNLFGQLSELGQVTPCQEGPRPRQLRLADDVILDYFFRVNIGISWVHGFSHSTRRLGAVSQLFKHIMFIPGDCKSHGIGRHLYMRETVPEVHYMALLESEVRR